MKANQNDIMKNGFVPVLKYYGDGEHCTQNYLDEVFPEIVDWLNKKLI